MGPAGTYLYSKVVEGLVLTCLGMGSTMGKESTMGMGSTMSKGSTMGMESTMGMGSTMSKGSTVDLSYHLNSMWLVYYIVKHNIKIKASGGKEEKSLL